MQITAAIARAPGAPYQIGKLELAAPGPHEVIVRLAATGICMTDVHGRDGYYGTPLPCVFGHEGAGVVEQIGSAVTGVAQGDHVVMVSPGCGACVHCAAKLPGYCVHARQVKFSGLLRNGAAPLRDQSGPVYGAFFQQSSFATYALALESNTIGVPKHFAFEHLAAFPCGVNTGAGAVMNVLKPRAGESFAVFGVGTVGLAGMLAAKIAGCDPIIAIDLHDNRLALARELGATHVINAAHDEPVASIQRITGRGAQYTLEAAGDSRVLRQAVDALALTGTACLAGSARPGTQVSFDMVQIQNGRTVRGCIQGDSWPAEFIPKLLDYFARGQLPVDRFVTTYPFGDINRAVDDMVAGRTIKAVLLMNDIHH